MIDGSGVMVCSRTPSLDARNCNDNASRVSVFTVASIGMQKTGKIFEPLRDQTSPQRQNEEGRNEIFGSQTNKLTIIVSDQFANSDSSRPERQTNTALIFGKLHTLDSTKIVSRERKPTAHVQWQNLTQKKK